MMGKSWQVNHVLQTWSTHCTEIGVNSQDRIYNMASAHLASQSAHYVTNILHTLVHSCIEMCNIAVYFYKFVPGIC